MRRDAFTEESNDRRSNLLVFGLPETSSLMEKVDNMLTYLTGTTSDVRDLFRIGRFKKETEHTSRPVLVKLSSAWDRKVVLLNKRKLKSYHIFRLFVREDLAPELRKRPVHPQSQPQETFHSTARHSSGPAISQGTPRHSSGPVTSQSTPQHSSGPVTSQGTPQHSSGPAISQDTPRHSSGPVTSQGTPQHSSGPVTSQGTPQHSSSPVNSVPASPNVSVCLQQNSRNAGLPSTTPIPSNLLTLTTPSWLSRGYSIIIMPPLRCLSYNCRGWNSGSLTLQNLVSSCDVCFMQEHWLHTDQLHKFNFDFLSVAVSGMDCGSLLCGRPYGGCSVLYRKSLSSCIIPVQIIFVA